MPILPQGPARRTTILQLIAFIAAPVICILTLFAYVLLTL